MAYNGPCIKRAERFGMLSLFSGFGSLCLNIVRFCDMAAMRVAFKTPRSVYPWFMPVGLFICYFPEPGSIEFMAFYSGAVQADRVSWEREIPFFAVGSLCGRTAPLERW